MGRSFRGGAPGGPSASVGSFRGGQEGGLCKDYLWALKRVGLRFPDRFPPYPEPRADLPGERVLGLQTWIPQDEGKLRFIAQRGPFSPPRNLLSNPFNCNCHLAWLGKWLRKRRIVSGNPRCQKPFFLKEIPIQDVAIQDFTCEGEKDGGRLGEGGGQCLRRQGC